MFFLNFQKFAFLSENLTVVMEDVKCESLQLHRLWFLAAENKACSIFLLVLFESIKKVNQVFFSQ